MRFMDDAALLQLLGRDRFAILTPQKGHPDVRVRSVQQAQDTGTIPASVLLIGAVRHGIALEVIRGSFFIARMAPPEEEFLIRPIRLPRATAAMLRSFAAEVAESTLSASRYRDAVAAIAELDEASEPAIGNRQIG